MPTTYSDEYLTNLLCSGSPEDFTIFYELCAAPLYGIIHRIILDDDAAEQLLTKAFLTICQPSFYNQSSNLMLFTRMINLARKLAITEFRLTASASKMTLESNMLS